MNFNFENDIILESNLLLLRPIRLEDIDNLLPIATEDKTLLQFSPKQIYTKKLLGEYVENALQERMNKSRYTFIIYHKEQHLYAGSTAFLNIVNDDDKLEIGATWLGNQFHGSGLNRECKYLLLNYSFNIIGANRVQFRTDERNTRSRKAIEKIGGRFEGIHREDMLMSDGYRRNTVYYSILKKEWGHLESLFFPL